MIHLVSVDFPPHADGGVASWTLDLALALHGRGEPVTVWTRRGPGAVEHDQGLPVPVRRMWGRSWGKHQALWAMAQLGPALRPGDRLLLSTWPLGRWLAPWARGRGHRVGVAFHGSELTRLQQAPPALREVLRHSDARFVVSGFLRDKLATLGGEAQVLPMPLPTLPARESPGEGLVVLARLTPLKGVDRALRLAKALDWPIQIIGEGSEGPSLRALAEVLGVKAQFWGRLPRAQALQRVAEAAVCALLPRPEADGAGAEGLGLCLLEASALGVPVLGCATGGVPEALGPGLLLPDPDDAAGSAQALRVWLSGADRGASARAWVYSQHGSDSAARAVMEALS